MNVRRVFDNERIVMPSWGLLWTFWTVYASLEWHASGGDTFTVVTFALACLVGGWGAVYSIVGWGG